MIQVLPDGLFVPAPSVIGVMSTPTIDMQLVAGVIFSHLRISAQAGNQIQLLPDGVYVPPSGLGISVQDTRTVDLTLSGGTLSADVVVSPAAGNQLQVTPQGLFVPPAASSLNVQDTTTVDLTVSGTTLSADVIVSPAAGNQLQVTPQGLYVPPSAGGITVQDTNTIDLTLSGSTLSAQAIVAPNNSLQATPNGLAVDLRDCNGNILPAGARLIQCGNLAPTDLPIGGTFIATAPGTAYRVRSVPCGSAPTHVLVGTGGNIVAAQRDGLGHTLGTIAMLPFVFFSFGNGAHVFDSVTITNPSQCRHLVVQVNGWGLGTLSCPANQLATIGFGVDDGLFFILDLGLSLYSASGFANALWGSLKERTALFIIPPGGSKTIRRIGDMTYGNCTVQVDSTFTFSGYLVSLL
ncbi:MAG: hypothetical protein RML84_09190 [Anaerolineae bacterium]|nr:hypothetical protein [Anaerolineae bacterium]